MSGVTRKEPTRSLNHKSKTWKDMRELDRASSERLLSRWWDRKKIRHGPRSLASSSVPTAFGLQSYGLRCASEVRVNYVSMWETKWFSLVSSVNSSSLVLSSHLVSPFLHSCSLRKRIVSDTRWGENKRNDREIPCPHLTSVGYPFSLLPSDMESHVYIIYYLSLIYWHLHLSYFSLVIPKDVKRIKCQ